jgi:hypothetical protein
MSAFLLTIVAVIAGVSTSLIIVGYVLLHAARNLLQKSVEMIEKTGNAQAAEMARVHKELMGHALKMDKYYQEKEMEFYKYRGNGGTH